jgi:hypothetical protein
MATEAQLRRQIEALSPNEMGRQLIHQQLAHNTLAKPIRELREEILAHADRPWARELAQALLEKIYDALNVKNQAFLDVYIEAFEMAPAFLQDGIRCMDGGPSLRGKSCGLCDQPINSRTAHRHGSLGWVGECCWDERLRATE